MKGNQEGWEKVRQFLIRATDEGRCPRCKQAPGMVCRNRHGIILAAPHAERLEALSKEIGERDVS